MRNLKPYIALFHHGDQLKDLPQTDIQRAVEVLGHSARPVYGAKKIFGICFTAPQGSARASNAKIRGVLGKEARVLVIELGEDFQDWAFTDQHDLSQSLKAVVEVCKL